MENKGKMRFRKYLLIIYLTFGLILVMILAFTLRYTGETVTTIIIDPNVKHQKIRSFGASDAWAPQYVGSNWPEEKREKMAELLFSTETDNDGNPKGIGLSSWRFNIGAGTVEQGDKSLISDEWRRTECFLSSDRTYDWGKQAGQRWFLEKAVEYAVKDIVGFINSPPIYYTKNGKGFAQSNVSTNLSEKHMSDFVQFIVKVLSHFEENGIHFDISPVNEPQWEWDKPNQEGSPYSNEDIYNLIIALDRELQNFHLSSKIELPEAARLNFLYANDSTGQAGDQIYAFFDPISKYYVGDLKSISTYVAAHSYFTTYPDSAANNIRFKLKNRLDVYPKLSYSMSEYCLLEASPNLKGEGRDLGIQSALYVAKVIHKDLTIANATTWQWWLAISPYDYKDGLIYIDYNKNGGNFYDSKMLWAFGNFSFFIRPGMHRIEVTVDKNDIEFEKKGLLISAYADDVQKVVIVVNESEIDQSIRIDSKGISDDYNIYVTNSNQNLQFNGRYHSGKTLIVGKGSITSLVMSSKSSVDQ